MSKPHFVTRYQNSLIFPYETNKDGSYSTHLMAAEIDDDGRIFAFPTMVQNSDGSFHRFSDNHEALRYNRRTGNVLEFDTLEEAINYSKGGYKSGTNMEPRRSSLIDLLLRTR